MARYGVPFDHIEERWTYGQTFCLLAVLAEQERKASGSGGMSMREFVAKQGDK